jgi:hypothetical protein
VIYRIKRILTFWGGGGLAVTVMPAVITYIFHTISLPEEQLLTSYCKKQNQIFEPDKNKKD